MSRYFFDLQNGDEATRDDQGVELHSRASVQKEIARILLDVARDEIPEQERVIVSVVVRDGCGKVISVANLTFNMSWLAESAGE